MKNLIILLSEGILKSSVELDVNINPNDQTLTMDKKMIEQVIINLIKNAVHAVRDHINPKISIRGYSLDGRYFISIEDNGEGIPFNTLDYG